MVRIFGIEEQGFGCSVISEGDRNADQNLATSVCHRSMLTQ
jgi:hypothetical protein